MKRFLAFLAAALFTLSLTGCAGKDSESAGLTDAPDSNWAVTNDDASPAPSTEAAPADSETPDEETAPAEPPDAAPSDGAAIYTFDGLEVPVPAEYAGLLTTDTNLDAWSDHWDPLISFSETASIEAGQLEHPGEDWGDGWLCTIVRLDQIGFEEWASGEGTGTTLFARGGDSDYYLMMHPTDVRFFRSGDEADADGSVMQWQMLNDWANALPQDIISRNSLTPYEARDLFDADYTYSGAHQEMGCSFPGEPMDLVVLALSQPEKQGEGGVWCVDRVRYVYSEYDWTDTHLVFPISLGIDMTAADYYAQLQSECDAGEHAELLTPEGAAVDYAKRACWLFGEDVSETDFEVIHSLG